MNASLEPLGPDHRADRPIRVGVDIGGTFTDLQIFDQRSGAVYEYKTPTTPADPSLGLLRGLQEAGAALDFRLDQIDLLLHGTTIATNAVLENKLPDGALITTAGFEDVLEIGRHMRHDVYGLYAESRRLLVPRSRRFGVRERIGAAGEVVTVLNEADVRLCARRLAAQNLSVVAICLLNAFANPEHERRLRDLLLAELPHLSVSISSEISPEIREYERTSTTVLNALLMPVVQGYLTKLRHAFAARGVSPHVLLIQSNGGSVGMRKAGEQPVRLLLSGPCGGTRALELLSASLSMPNLVGLDIGGTSCDIGLVQDGRTAMVPESAIDGCPVRMPMIDIRTIGAGGGSLAWIDPTGRMRVGPQSAGADPGPACYGRGGTGPTVTDANVVLGRIDPDRFMGGALRLRPAGAREAIEAGVCSVLGIGLEPAAEGIISITTAATVNAIRLSLFERGLDPEDFTLVSFGGAGGLHAATIAEELGINRVVYPLNASTLSAFGILWSNIAHDLASTKLRLPDRDTPAQLDETMAELRRQGNALLEADGVPPELRSMEFALDIRYRGQGFELSIPIPDAAMTGTVLDAAVMRFHQLHQKLFSHADPDEAIELLTTRLTARGQLSKPALAPFVPSPAQAPSSRRIYLSGAWQDLPVHLREDLATCVPVAGPALIQEKFTSLLIPAGWQILPASTGDLVATRKA